MIYIWSRPHGLQLLLWVIVTACTWLNICGQEASSWAALQLTGILQDHVGCFLLAGRGTSLLLGSS